VTLAALLAAVCAASENGADAGKVRQVAEGRLSEANAAWWGFDAEDATDALQAAINSRAKTVVVPNMGRPWVVRPVFLRSGLELVFEDGVVVEAKKGEFLGGADSLFSASKAEGLVLRGAATLRMRKADYENPDVYVKAEWRSGIALYGCRNVRIEGLTIAETGGDGVFIRGAFGGSPSFCENVTIRRVVCDGNYRQGVSVVSVKGLLIEDCVMKNTRGTAPAAGIDLEPDHNNEMLQDVVIRRCVIQNNEGSGLVIYGRQLDGAREPISILVEKCVVRGGGAGASGICVSALSERSPKGLVEIRDCEVENVAGPGLFIMDKSPAGARVVFSRCALRNVASAVVDMDGFGTGKVRPPAIAPVTFFAFRPKLVPVNGGVEFEDCRVEDNQDRPAALAVGGKEGIRLAGVKGRLIRRGPGKARLELGANAESCGFEAVSDPRP